MVPLFWLAALTKTVLCVTIVVALGFISTELTKTGLDSEGGQQVVSLCTNDSGTLRPRSSNIK